jgi:hypothetical protein
MLRVTVARAGLFTSSVIDINTPLGRLLHGSTSACVPAEPCLANGDALNAKAAEELAGIRAAGTYKVEREITTPQAASIGKGQVSRSCVAACCW